MDIREVLKFVQKEIPEQTQEMWAVIDLLDTTIENMKEKIDGTIGKLASERSFDKASEYIAISKALAEINDMIQKHIKEYALKVEETESFLIEDEEVFPIEIEKNGRIDYEKYRVDEEVAYNLYTNFTHKKPAAFALEGVKYPARQWKIIFTKTCELLNKKNNSLFESFTYDVGMQGTKRSYFAKNTEGMIKPIKIAGTSIFVETNLSANTIRNIIIDMLEKYKIPKNAFQIYLSKDLTPIHMKNLSEQTEHLEETCINDLDEKVCLQQEIKCVYFDFKKSVCMCEKSPNFIQSCDGLSGCRYYLGSEVGLKKQVLNVVPIHILNKRVCPICDLEMVRSLIQVEYISENIKKEQQLAIYQCRKCKKKYVTDDLYNSYMQDERITDINIVFAENDMS